MKTILTTAVMLHLSCFRRSGCNHPGGRRWCPPLVKSIALIFSLTASPEKPARPKQPLCRNLPSAVSFCATITERDTFSANSSRSQFDSRRIGRPGWPRGPSSSSLQCRLPLHRTMGPRNSSQPSQHSEPYMCCRDGDIRHQNQRHRRNKPPSRSKIEFQRESDVF